MRETTNAARKYLKDATGASIENISALDRIARETGGTFDPSGDAIDFYESLEGMLLQVNSGDVDNATRSFGSGR